MASKLGPIMQNILARYGLETLTQWAVNLIADGSSPAEIELQLYDRPEFQSRFAGMFMREKAGYPPIAVDEYLSYENTAASLATMWDISLSKDEVDRLIANNVSAVELENRFTLAAQALYETPEEDRDEFQRLYNVSEGKLLKYWMDPKTEFGKLQKQFTAARIAGSAIRSGFGELTAQEAERLSDVGLTGQTAAQSFAELYNIRDLFEPVDDIEGTFDREKQLGVIEGQAELVEELDKRLEKRIAEFAGGGGFAAGGEGFKGTGSAES